MKKKYILTLEFEAEIIEKVPPKIRKKDRYFNKLLKILLKSDQSILKIYRNLLMSDLGDGNNIYDIDKNIRILKVKYESEVLKQVIELLLADEKNHFLKILESGDKRADDFLEDFFGHFGGLTVKDAKFTEKNIGS